MEISDFEGIIKSFARRFASGQSEIEDFEQIGRTTAWQVIETKPDKPPAYVSASIKYAMLNKIKRDSAKKRMPEGGLVSIHEPLIDGKEFTLEDILGEEAVFRVDDDLKKLLFQTLKSKYGYFFIREIINQEEDPQEMVRKIIRIALEDVAGLTPDEIPHVVSYQFFRGMGLERLLWTFYRNSPYRAVDDAYPDTFVLWEFRRVSNNFWSGSEGWNNVLYALKWFAQAMELHTSEDCRYVKLEDFERYGLNGMVQVHFNWSPYLALSAIFPDLKPWQTKQTSANYFLDRNNREEALKWFLLHQGIGQISKISPEEVYDTDIRVINVKKSLEDDGLRALLKQYDNSTYRLFTDIFPEQILPWTLRFMKIPWRDEPYKVAGDAIRWLFEDYLEIPINQIPSYATCKLFWNVGFSGILTNRRMNFNSSPYAAVDNAYPGRFSPEDFDKHRRIIGL